MSETKRKVPKLRFPGFTEDWEQRKFSEITVNIGKRNKENLNLEPYAITKDDGFIPQAEAHDEFGYMKETDRKAYNIVKPNSFGYNPARINVGSIGYYSGTEDIIVSSLYEIFQTSENIYDRFLWHWFKSKQFQNWIERLQEGSVRLYFYYDKLCECEIFIPTVDEQIKIGNSLDRFDNLITLHQRKLENLKLKKKALLQKLFPKNGEQFPELRFPGFTDAWEQRKLGDYLSIPAKEQLGVNSFNDLLRVKLNLGGVELGANRDTLSLGSTTYYKRLAGQFIYGKQNFFNGSMGIIPEELDGKGSSGDVPSLNISNILPEFLYTYVSRECYWRPKEASASGTGSKRIHEATLLSFDIAVPDEQEQKLIATCMNGITNLITLHQRKLEHLQLQKKALLQQMFV